MNCKNKPSLLNIVSFRSQTIEEIAQKIATAEGKHFGASYSPVPEMAAPILSGQYSLMEIRQKFNVENGDFLEAHRLAVAIELFHFGRKLGKTVHSLEPFELEILRGQIWVNISPLGYYVENGVATIIDYNPRTSLGFTSDHVAFSGAITVAPYAEATPMFEYESHNYLMLDLSSKTKTGERETHAFHSDDTGFLSEDVVVQDLQKIADAYKLVRAGKVRAKREQKPRKPNRAPLFDSAGIELKSDSKQH